jgi:hypothetical protein
VNWTRLEHPGLDDRGVRFGGVRSDRSRVVAWGDKDAEDGVGPPGSRAISIVLTSDDGLAWRRHEARLPGGEPFRLAIVNVSAEGFAALGSSGGPMQMATSVDGGEWRLVDAPVQPPGPVFPSAGGLVTVGLGAAAPVVFVTRDGSDWRAIHGPAQPGQYQIGDIARTADGLVIAGAFGAQGNWDGLLWRWKSGELVDVGGREPAFVGPARSVTLHRAVPHAGGVYVRGSVDLAVPGECAARDGPVAALGPPIADVCGRTDLVWASSDWVRWHELEDTLPLMSPDTLVAGVDGLVALLHAGPGGENFGDDPSVWTSSDGLEWRRLGDGIASATTLVALPDRLIAFAPDPPDFAREPPDETGFTVWVGTPR